MRKAILRLQRVAYNSPGFKLPPDYSQGETRNISDTVIELVIYGPKFPAPDDFSIRHYEGFIPTIFEIDGVSHCGWVREEMERPAA